MVTFTSFKLIQTQQSVLFFREPIIGRKDLPGSPCLDDPGITPPAGTATGAFATDATGRLFGGDVTTTARVYTTSGGVPTHVSSTNAGTATAWDGLLHPAGFYMVVGSGSGVGVLKINGSGASTTLTPAAGSPFATGGNGPFSLALDQSGAFVFVTNTGSRNLTTFAINTSTGVLTSAGVQPPSSLGTTGNLGGLASVPSISSSSDFDGDGHDDLVIRNTSNGSVSLMLFANPGAPSPLWIRRPLTTIAGVGDADGWAPICSGMTTRRATWPCG